MGMNFRPHHFLCALCFRGNGYSPSFVANFSALMAELNSEDGEQMPITIVNQTDSICKPCPHRIDTTCTSQAKITLLDERHAEALALEAGQMITWGEAKKKIKERITLSKFHEICETCEWKKWGICENVLLNFLTPQEPSFKA